MADDLDLSGEARRELANASPDDLRFQRPSFDLWFMEIAHVVAKRASCRRKQVGAVLVRDDDRRILSTGYNGAPRGMPDCFEVGCELRDFGGKPSCVRTLHAESNALDLVAPSPGEKRTLYCTTIPCRDCALRIIQHGIQRVIYAEYYESRSTKDVVDLFAAHDRSTLEQQARKLGWPMAAIDGDIKPLMTPRAQLLQIDMQTGELRQPNGRPPWP